MLDAKLDKIHMPALKKFIRDNFASLEKSIQMLQMKKDCPKAAGIIMEGVRCVCCGATNICGEVGTHPVGMLHVVRKKVQHKLPHACSCRLYNPPKPGDPRTQVTSRLLDAHLKVKRRNDESNKCFQTNQPFDLLEGFDGNLYRKG